MDAFFLAWILFSIGLPVVLTVLYRSKISPLRRHTSLSSLSTSYRGILILSAVLPALGTVGLPAIEQAIDMDTIWPVFFGLTLIMCTLVIDAALFLARKNKWAYLLALPYFGIAVLSVLTATVMALLSFDDHPRFF